MVKVERTLLILVMLLLPLKALAIGSLQASVDRNPVMDNEYFVLTVTADDQLASNALDTSALLKDFAVGRTSVSRSTQIVNFDTHKETNWRITLKAKHQGISTIPAFEIDGVKSQPIAMQVVDAGSQPEQKKNLFVKSTVSTDEAYVGQVITYKVKLYLAVDFRRGVLSTPKAEGAQLKQIGDDKDSNEIVNGRRYRVIERTYSLIADTPGKLDISAPTFQGDIMLDSPSVQNAMFTYQDVRQVEVQGDALAVTINPKPASYVGNWLVADLVTLNEDWQDNQSFEVGQPITRSITLLASNADDTSLPDIKLPLPQGMKSYPEKPQRKTMARAGQTIAQLSQTVAIVPSKPGKFTLPEVKVAWWNPHLNKEQYATLPARSIEVKPAADTPAPTIDAPAPQVQQSAGFWPWTTALFAVLWLVTLAIWWRARQHPAAQANSVDGVHGKTAGANAPATATSSLDNAIAQQNSNNNSGEVLNALLRELSAFTKQTVTLDNLPQIAPALAQTVSEIQAARYSRNPTDTGALYQQLKSQLASFKGAKTQHSKTSSLMSLNP